MGDGDNYGDVQQPAGGYADAGAGGADAPTSYGDVQNPASPYDKKPVPTPPPAGLITQVKSDLAAVKLSLQGADLIDMKRHSNYADFKEKDVDFAAWTNSAQHIYIDLDHFQKNYHKYVTDKTWTEQEFQNNRRATTLTVVVHELEHVSQFKGNNGPPKTFLDMITFEFKAYGNTMTWLANSTNNKFLSNTVGATTDLLESLTDSMTKGRDNFDKMRTITNDLDAQKRLIAEKDLPAKVRSKKSYVIGDLYKTDPP